MPSSAELTPTDGVVVPGIVADAMKVEFGVPVTAYLCSVAFLNYCAIGLVFVDRFARFKNGNSIRTSNVLGTKMVNGYTVLETLNSWYVVCSWANDDMWAKTANVLH